MPLPELDFMLKMFYGLFVIDILKIEFRSCVRGLNGMVFTCPLMDSFNNNRSCHLSHAKYASLGLSSFLEYLKSSFDV